ncbi:MAG: hypothetical protein H0V44_09395 [Planctomycetes bacterium]|nr:hypothetical protein [Planctomycetota bacterium]
METYRFKDQQTLKEKVDKVWFDRDLCRALMGIEIGIGGLLFYVGLIILMAVGAMGAGLGMIALGMVIALIGSVPIFKPDLPRRLGLGSPGVSRRVRAA